ncbi:hypothetical protein MTR_8g010650 [Medicago truncatula]|uniref:Uncharacterized protein n=1 Tax=Medicago truncatula TaxID=3880 RepID=A0A072TLH8_MEDTR|nr:hypothetical protein MTR_8g010650 [Medicago truncatula]
MTSSEAEAHQKQPHQKLHFTRSWSSSELCLSSLKSLASFSSKLDCEHQNMFRFTINSASFHALTVESEYNINN